MEIIFSPLKLSLFFSSKDKILDNLGCFVVYKFTCPGCNTSYVSHTTRHIATRIKEHLKSDKNSHILKHFNSSAGCKEKCCEKSFKILDSSATKFALKLKEPIWIKLTMLRRVLACKSMVRCIRVWPMEEEEIFSCDKHLSVC